MKNLIMFLAILGFPAAPALAQCPASPPAPPKFAPLAGDEKVDAGWLRSYVAGKSLYWSYGGIEQFKADGSYVFSNTQGRWTAPSYRIYDNGIRCIYYENRKRFDYYILNNGTLNIIQDTGKRSRLVKTR